MSRIGKLPIEVPSAVTVTVAEGNVVTVKGPKGTLEKALPKKMGIEFKDGVLTVTRPDESRESRALHGLTRALLFNMVEGVNNGFKKELIVTGVGYRAALQGKQLVMNIGYSHQVTVDPVDGITIEVPEPNRVVILGADKQVVGQFAADVRAKRPPEPYKGTGIRYSDEVVRRKEGKAGLK